MKIGHLKNYIAFIFVAIFLFLKVAGLHVLTHDDDNIEHCDVCDLVTATNFTPIIGDTAQNQIEGNFEFCLQANTINDYNFVYRATTNIDCLFSRPPPFSI